MGQMERRDVHRVATLLPALMALLLFLANCANNPSLRPGDVLAQISEAESDSISLLNKFGQELNIEIYDTDPGTELNFESIGKLANAINSFANDPEAAIHIQDKQGTTMDIKPYPRTPGKETKFYLYLTPEQTRPSVFTDNMPADRQSPGITFLDPDYSASSIATNFSGNDHFSPTDPNVLLATELGQGMMNCASRESKPEIMTAPSYAGHYVNIGAQEACANILAMYATDLINGTTPLEKLTTEDVLNPTNISVTMSPETHAQFTDLFGSKPIRTRNTTSNISQ